jgi:predicted dehydrogenase
VADRRLRAALVGTGMIAAVHRRAIADTGATLAIATM